MNGYPSPVSSLSTISGNITGPRLLEQWMALNIHTEAIPMYRLVPYRRTLGTWLETHEKACRPHRVHFCPARVRISRRVHGRDRFDR